MRTAGTVSSARGLAPNVHVGWTYHGVAEFRARAAEFIRDGLAAGQWIEYVGGADVATLHAELTGMDSAADALARGMAGITPVDDCYVFVGDSDVVDPDASVARRVAVTEQLLAAGFTGVRAVADVTSVVRTPAQREAFARFEHLVDHEMSRLPVSALCAYDVARLGAEPAAELTCLHPLTNPRSPAFRLYAEPGVDFALGGALDAASNSTFRRCIDHAVHERDRELVVDTRAAEFIDHRSLTILAERGRQLGAVISVRTARPSTRRMIEILDYPELRVAP